MELFCQICNKSCYNFRSLAIHVNKQHKINKQEYYDKYLIKDEKEKYCTVCGNEASFKNLSKGYFKTCSIKCGQNTKESLEKRKETNLKKYGKSNPMEVDSIKNKLKNTNLLKYGVENAFQNKNIQEKQRNTVRKKYGVAHIFQLDSTKEKFKKTMVEKYGVENPFQMEDFKEKVKSTSLIKYNTDLPCQSEEIKLKIKNTNLEKFGETTPIKNKDIKEKIKQNNIKKYGVEHISKTERYKIKYKETSINKYGTKHPNQSQEIKNKIEKTNIEKYGTKHSFSSPIIKEKIKNTINERYNVDYSSQSLEWKLKYRNNFYKKLINSKRLNGLTPLFKVDEYFGILRENEYKFQCNDCKNIFLDNLANGKIPRCLNCYPYNSGISRQEKEVVDFIKSIKKTDDLIIENCKNIINPLELDIYLPEYNLAIEFDGLYWHSENQGKTKYYHSHKTNMCNNKDIQLIHIFEDEWFNKREIIESIIKRNMKIYDKKIYENDCIIKEVPFKEANLFLEDNHFKGSLNYGKSIGIYYKDEIVSLFTYSKCRKNCNKNQFELLRYCSKINTYVFGDFDRFLNYFKQNNNGSLIYYSDIRYENINIYKNTELKYINSLEPKCYYTNDYLTRYDYKKIKNNLKNISENFNLNLSEWENMKLFGYDRIWDCGDNVFVCN